MMKTYTVFKYNRYTTYMRRTMGDGDIQSFANAKEAADFARELNALTSRLLILGVSMTGDYDFRVRIVTIDDNGRHREGLLRIEQTDDKSNDEYESDIDLPAIAKSNDPIPGNNED